MSPQRSLALLVVTAMMLLAVLAHASPPDPNWIGGFWDNADYDDVVLLVTSGLGAADSHSADAARPVVLISPLVATPDENRLAARPRLSSATRAPPSV
jgi:hypothetical protein